MGESYKAVLWNGQKRFYDAFVAGLALTFLLGFFGWYGMLHPDAPIQTIVSKSFGWLTFLLLHLILVIGPLCRLNPYFLVFLYNRRHLGVFTFLSGLAHGGFNLIYYHGFGDTNPIISLFLSNTRYGSLEFFPFQTLGFCALLIMGLMAVSSHDFWLKTLGPIFWKGLHMMVYVAYGMLLFHVCLGALQDRSHSGVLWITLSLFFTVFLLHIVSATKSIWGVRASRWLADGSAVIACRADDLEEGMGKVVKIGGKEVALFLHEGRVYGVGNACCHQGGPLGEGRIVNGCITCPWHGYQYLPHNGCSPPPFQEKVPTYNLQVRDRQVLIDPRPNEAGQEVVAPPLLKPSLS